MDIMTYIIDNCLIVIPALYIVGVIIKAIPKIPDWIIPFVLLAIGEAACIGIMGASVDAAIQGVLVTGAAVLVNQGIKQATNRD